LTFSLRFIKFYVHYNVLPQFLASRIQFISSDAISFISISIISFCIHFFFSSDRFVRFCTQNFISLSQLFVFSPQRPHLSLISGITLHKKSKPQRRLLCDFSQFSFYCPNKNLKLQVQVELNTSIHTVRSARVPASHNRSQHIQANNTRGFIQSVLLTMGIIVSETC